MIKNSRQDLLSNDSKDNDEFKSLKGEINLIKDLTIKDKEIANNTKKIKEFLNANYPNIGACKIMNKVFLQSYSNGSTSLYDYSENGFFKYDKLRIHSSSLHIPASTKEELENNESKIYSFRFLKESYNNPRKVYLSTDASKVSSTLNDFNDQSLLNLLGNSSIESLVINNQLVDIELLKYILNTSNSVKSLSIVCNLKESQIGELSFENSKVEKLILKQHDKESLRESLTPIVPSIFKILSTRLTTLGLEYSNIQDVASLSPLIKFENIKKLNCNQDNLNCFLKHIESNSNINTLKCRLAGFWSDESFSKDAFIKSLNSFTNKNCKLIFNIDILDHEYDYSPNAPPDHTEDIHDQFLKDTTSIVSNSSNLNIILNYGTHQKLN